MKRPFPALLPYPASFSLPNSPLCWLQHFTDYEKNWLRKKAINVKDIEKGKCLTFSYSLFSLLVYHSCAHTFLFEVFIGLNCPWNYSLNCSKLQEREWAPVTVHASRDYLWILLTRNLGYIYISIKNTIPRYFFQVHAIAFISCILFLCPFLVFIMTTFHKSSRGRWPNHWCSRAALAEFNNCHWFCAAFCTAVTGCAPVNPSGTLWDCLAGCSHSLGSCQHSHASANICSSEVVGKAGFTNAWITQT